MKLCMFTPKDLQLERGWPGIIEGDTVVQLAAQTLQAFFTGGGSARRHAEYPLAEVDLRAPVLHPPAVRDFYAFEQHVKTARALRGQEVPPEWYEIPVFYFSNPAASSPTCTTRGMQSSRKRRATRISDPATCSARARSAPAASSSTATGAGCSVATSSSSRSRGSAYSATALLDSALGSDSNVSADMENLMPIGEFASAAQLSQKALRLYGDSGLLAPAWADPDSCSRYY